MPLKTNTPLFVNANGVLFFSISLKRVKVISRIKHQCFNAGSGMKNHQPFSCLPFKRLKTANGLIVEQLFSISTGKRFGHLQTLLRQAGYVEPEHHAFGFGLTHKTDIAYTIPRKREFILPSKRLFATSRIIGTQDLESGQRSRRIWQITKKS
jgi:hypothetical protein